MTTPNASPQKTAVKVVLEYLAGPAQPLEPRRVITPVPGGYTLGRSMAASWPLPEDSLLSRSHFRLDATDLGCTLTDLGSTNGTNQNDEPLEAHEEVELQSGDLIQAGRCIFRVRFEPADTAMNRAAEMETVEAETGHEPQAQAVPPEMVPIPAAAGRVCSLCQRFVENPGPMPTSSNGLVSHVWVCADCRPSHSTINNDEDLAPHFETLRLLGRGSMGVVYLARHRVTGKSVALKIIDPETATTRTAIDRFLREMAVIGTLRHPNIVECLDQGMDDGHLWFAMEYVSGMSLETLAQANRGNYPVNQACRIICQVLKGLEYAHEKGFVHRDIKPENILIGRTAENRLIAKISDFGLAKNYQSMGASGLTFSGEMRGTIPFMPPEQMIDFKTVKPSADLYSTAATLYYLIAGTYVFDADDSHDDMIQLLLDHKIVPLTDRRPDVPEPLSDLVACCLARRPEDRLPTAAAMRNALKAFA